MLQIYDKEKPMKTRFSLLGFMVILILLTACTASRTNTPAPQGDTLAPTAEVDSSNVPTPTLAGNPITPTPEIFNPLNPSPTPSESTLPPTCQVTDLNVYQDPVEGYCFAYPLRFKEGDQPWVPGRPGIMGPPVDNSADPVYALLVVDVAPLNPEKSLDQQAEAFLKDFTVVDPNSMARARITVGGESALQVEAVPVQLSWRIVFVPHAGRLFRLMYWPVDVAEAQADLDELYQTTLNSFAFLSSNSSYPTNPTPVVQLKPKEGLEVSFGSLSLVVPPGLASGASGSMFPRVDGQNAAWYELTPGHTQLTLDGYLLSGKSHQPQVFVYPAKDYAELHAVAAQSIQRLQPILSNPQAPASPEQLPIVPFFNDVQVFAADIQVLSFQNGLGLRFLSQYAQTAPPANNADLFYQFQGLTSDGAYYVIAILPITAPGLGESSDPASAIPVGGVAYPSMGDPNANWKGYYAAVTDLLNTTPPKAFTPTLAQLDTLIESMSVSP